MSINPIHHGVFQADGSFALRSSGLPIPLARAGQASKRALRGALVSGFTSANLMRTTTGERSPLQACLKDACAPCEKNMTRRSTKEDEGAQAWRFPLGSLLYVRGQDKPDDQESANAGTQATGQQARLCVCSVPNP